MGKIKKGILGGFNGRVGNVIGGSWKGISYMRSEAQSIKDPKTTRQLAQRGGFGYVSDWASRLLPLVKIGFNKFANKRSEFNSCVSYNVGALVAGGHQSEPEQGLPNFLVSRGSFGYMSSLTADYSVTDGTTTVRLAPEYITELSLYSLGCGIVVYDDKGKIVYALSGIEVSGPPDFTFLLPFDLSQYSAYAYCFGFDNDGGSATYLMCCDSLSAKITAAE